MHDNYNDNDSNRDYSDNQNNIPIDIAGDTKNNKNKNNNANDRNSNNDTNDNNIKNNLNISDTKSVSTISLDLQNLEPKPVIFSDVINTVNRKKNMTTSAARLTPDDIGSTYDDQSSTDTADIVLINDAENRLTKKFENKTIFESSRDNKFEKKVDVRGDIIAAEITTVSLPLSQPPVISQPDEDHIDAISATGSSTSSLPLSLHMENVPSNVGAGGGATRMSKRKYSSMNSAKSSSSSSLCTTLEDSASGCPIATVSLAKTDESDRHREKDKEKEKEMLTRGVKEVVLEIKEVERNARKARMRSPSNLIEETEIKENENITNASKMKKNDAWKKKGLISLSEILKDEKIEKVVEESKIIKKMKK